MRTLFVFLVILASGTAGAPSPAHARGKSRAEAGIKAFKAGDYVKASEDLATALRDEPGSKTAPKAALYLGNAYLKLGQLGKAKDALRQALALDPKSKKKKTIEKLIEIIESRDVGTLTIGSTPPGATIRVDGETGARGKTPLELSLPPGPHKLAAELEGHEVAGREHLFKSGEAESLDFTLRALECELAVAATPLGAQAAIDGATPVDLPAKVTVKAGPHKIALSAPAHEVKTETVTCDGRTPLAVQTALAPVAAPPEALALAAEVPKPAATPAQVVKAAEEKPAAPIQPLVEAKPAPAPGKVPALAAATVPPPAAPLTPVPPPARAPEARSSWGWIVAGAVVGAVGLGVAGYLMFRPRDPEPSVGTVSLGPTP